MIIELEGTIFPKVGREQIVKVQKEIDVEFPKEYFDFLVDQNGGYPVKCEFELPDKTDKSIVNMFYPIGEMKTNLKRRNRLRLHPDFIAIGNDSGGNQILLGVSGDEIGRVYFWEHDVDPEEENPMHFLANSFNDFLKMLHE